MVKKLPEEGLGKILILTKLNCSPVLKRKKIVTSRYYSNLILINVFKQLRNLISGSTCWVGFLFRLLVFYFVYWGGETGKWKALFKLL